MPFHAVELGDFAGLPRLTRDHSAMGHILRFDKILDEAMTVIRRAAVFLGLGVNAANRPDLRDYQLTDETMIQILSDVPDSVVDEWKSVFKIWIVAGGFREVIEHLCLFLDRIFHCLLKVPGGPRTATWKQFERSGLAAKLQFLKEDFGVSSGFDEALATLSPIRNCLIHRLGVVRQVNAPNGELVLQYHAPRYFVEMPSGTVDVAQERSKASPIFCPEGGTVSVEPFKLYTRSFRPGDQIYLSPHELHQILFFSIHCINRLLLSATEYCVSKGLEVAKAAPADPSS